MGRPDNPIARMTPRSLVPFVVIATVVAVTIIVLPISYQTNDDPFFAEILQGNAGLGTAPDGHSLMIHIVLGSIVSSLSTAFPEIAWYGILMASLYVLAYAAIGSSVLSGFQAQCGPRKWPVLVPMALGFALFPLLLFQWTIVAGLLAIAGLLPCAKSLFLNQKPGRATWVIALLCLILGSMVRFKMVVAMVIIFTPAALLISLLDHDLRRLGKCVPFGIAVIVACGFLHFIEVESHGVSSEHERFHAYNEVRRNLSNRVRLPMYRKSMDLEPPAIFPTSTSCSGTMNKGGTGGGPIGLSTVDQQMLLQWMVFDSGPYRFENLRLFADGHAARSPVQQQKSQAGDSLTVTDTSRLVVQNRTEEKVRWLLAGRSIRHIVLLSFLVVVLGTATSLVAAAATVGEWRVVIILCTMLFGVGVLSLVTLIAFDRAVFRVLFPMVNFALVMSVELFPNKTLWREGRIAPFRRGVFRIALINVCALATIGLLISGFQIRLNRSQAAEYEEMIRSLQTTIGSNYTLVTWPAALHVEYLSPFIRADHVHGRIYGIEVLSSHPNMLKVLQDRFGTDIYSGLVAPNVAHIIDSYRVEILKDFYAEKYDRDIEARRLISSGEGENLVEVWVLADSHGRK